MVRHLVRVLAAALVGGAVLAPGTAGAHPMHTSLTKVTRDAASGRARLMIRVFADDYLGAVNRGRPVAATDAGGAESLVYLQRSLAVMSGPRALGLRFCGVERVGEMLWICAETDGPVDRAGISMRNQILCDRFGDQVNIVQSATGPRTRSTLFVRGDGAKPVE